MAAPYWRWEHASKRRYYEVRITCGLWGDWYVLRVWGAIGLALGGERRVLAADQGQALQIVERLARRRAQRGYLPA